MIHVLSLIDGDLYKTVKFKNPNYIGDPINAIKIFNDKEVDEIVVIDIRASKDNTPINFKKIEEMASECFMPLGYGGGIKTLEDAKQIFKIGGEKVIVNSAFVDRPQTITEIANIFGSQSMVVAIDVKKSLLGKEYCYFESGQKSSKMNPVEAAKRAEELGAGEIILTSISLDGTRRGYDLDLIQRVSGQVGIPVVACGGAHEVPDYTKAVNAGASAVAAGSMFVYKGSVDSILINYPDQNVLISDFYSQVK